MLSIGSLRILSFKIQKFFVWQYFYFPQSAKIYTIFSNSDKKVSRFQCSAVYKTPLCITCWILLLLNLHCMWPCRNLSLLFMHCMVLGRTSQNPTSAVFTFMLRVYVAKSFCCFLTFLWCTLHNLSFAGFELQVRQNRDGMPSPVHFFNQQTCIWYTNGRQQTFTVTAVLPH